MSQLTLLVTFPCTCFQGLRAHAAEEGGGGALEALAASVGEGQRFFVDCLAEAADVAGLTLADVAAGVALGGLAAAGAGAGVGPGPGGVAWGAAGSSRPGTSASMMGGGAGGSPGQRVPGAGWDRLLRLGQLGLTRADIARLDAIRRQQAARTIQRAARRWMRRRRHRRRLAEARARADAMQRKLRCARAGRRVFVTEWLRCCAGEAGVTVWCAARRAMLHTAARDCCVPQAGRPTASDAVAVHTAPA